MSGDHDPKDAAWCLAFLHVHGIGDRSKRRFTPTPRLPSMPRSTWRVLAAICGGVGAMLGAWLTGGDGSRSVAAAIVGGLLAIAIGMYVIEMIWLRRRSRPRR